MKDKEYYSPQEVSKALGIKTYVLRYWETQFPFLKPERTKAGWRRYRKDDVAKFILVKKLLYDEHFTIKGAKRRLKELNKQGELNLKETFQKTKEESILQEIISELQEMLEILKGKK